MPLTEEDIKKMSPEQLRELQKQQCIFCHIISKRVQSKIVYEDEKVTAVLDINPANPGHVLLLPKEHYSVMPQMPDDLVAYMGTIAKQLSHAMLRAVGADSTTILAANGLAAGQRASHFMMHIIPRKEGDNVGISLPPGEMSEEQLRQTQRLLAPLVAKAFGKEYVEEPKGKVAEDEPKKTQEPSPKAEPTKAEEKKTEPVTQKPEEEREESDDAKPKANLDDITSLLLGGKQ